LKKIHKLSPCNVLSIYEKKYPTVKWDKEENNFKNYRRGTVYNRLKSKIFERQGGLCAYCESHVMDIHKQRIEHFNDKSNSTPSNNLHLDWNNIFGVCLGGSDIRNKENPLFPTPDNLSCDAYKEHKHISYMEILNPFDISAFPSIFKFDKRTHKLEVDEEKCQEAGIDTAKVSNTIISLNLNCDRLTTERHQILINYNQEIEKGRKSGDKNVKKKLANKWFYQTYPSFFTTRRILLEEHAETYLKEHNFNG